MILLILVSLILIISLLIPKQIHKYNYYIYAVAFIVSLVTVNEEANIFSLGFVPLSFFVVVMYTGVFERGKIRKRLMMVRAENAVLGSIFLIPHAYGFLEFLIDEGKLLTNIVPVLGLFSLIAIVPLFLTSFRFIRKQYSYKEWKKLHEIAYLVYLLLFLHLLFLNNSRLLSYVIIFGVFFTLKAYDKSKIYLKNKTKIKKKMA